MEELKKVPMPMWIGLGLILIVIVIMNRNAGQQQQQATPVAAPVGPVTTATVGTQGAQVGAGTDQQLANLSVITQSGFAQLTQQNQQLARSVAGGMNGVGPTMQQVGSSMQSVQNSSAADNATNGTVGQNAGTNPAPIIPSTSSTP